MKEHVSPERHTGGWSGGFDEVRTYGDGNSDMQALSFARGVVADPQLQWLGKAVCPQTDPEAFHPEKGMPNKAAKQICNTACVVKDPCLERALEIGADGIWGGTSERERRVIRKQREQAEKQDKHGKS